LAHIKVLHDVLYGIGHRISKLKQQHFFPYAFGDKNFGRHSAGVSYSGRNLAAQGKLKKKDGSNNGRRTQP
jgi:hypothetical protein